MAMPKTMVHALHESASRLGHRPALWSKRNGVYLPTSWRQYADRVRHFALGLRKLGFGPGKVMCVLAFNREEWAVAELAAMALGGACVGVYTTSSPEQIEFILNHSEAPIFLVENEAYLRTVKGIRSKLRSLKHLLVMDSSAAGDGVRSYQEILQEGAEADESVYWDHVNALKEGDLAAMIYTSGTTGNPKGVMLSQKNLVFTATKLLQSSPLKFGKEVLLSYLPLSHIAEQQGSIHIPILGGFQVYFAESLDKVPQNLREVRPTAFFGVPRVWEKFQAKAEEGMKGVSPVQAAILERARKVTLDRHRRALRGERVPLAVEAQYQTARRVVFEKLKQKIGFDRTEVFLTSAAPIALDVLEFFASIDIIVREIYGQSEVTGPTSVSTEEATRLGRLGMPMLGVEVKIADDGEILVRGDNVCMG
ncbi:MAG: AMP-dependent synthetase/ligase, partial [Myxococcaceae bacterium]